MLKKETDHYKAKAKKEKKDQGYSAYLISHPHDKKKQKKNPTQIQKTFVMESQKKGVYIIKVFTRKAHAQSINRHHSTTPKSEKKIEKMNSKYRTSFHYHNTTKVIKEKKGKKNGYM